MLKANSTGVDDLALQYLEENGTTTISKLHDALCRAYPSLTKAETTDVVWRLVGLGRAELELPAVDVSFADFLRHWEWNLGLYVSLAVSLAMFLLIYTIPSTFPFEAVRLIVGSAFIFFIPGYMTTEAFFPRVGDMSSIGRFALSIGLSMALAMFVGLLLNYTPWGISLLPITVSLTTVTITLGTVGLARR